jgi:hypothetical protein
MSLLPWVAHPISLQTGARNREKGEKITGREPELEQEEE